MHRAVYMCSSKHVGGGAGLPHVLAAWGGGVGGCRRERVKDSCPNAGKGLLAIPCRRAGPDMAPAVPRLPHEPPHGKAGLLYQQTA